MYWFSISTIGNLEPIKRCLIDGSPRGKILLTPKPFVLNMYYHSTQDNSIMIGNIDANLPDGAMVTKVKQL